MKKRIYIKLAIFLVTATLFFSACRDPIFYSIAQEVAPIEPRIRGGPTNMVVWQDHLFVASGSVLHWYRNARWDNMETLPYNVQHLYQQLRRPDGRITMLAATMDYLYALILHGDDSTVIRRFNPGAGSWDSMIMEPARQGLIIQTIFAPNPDSNNLFIGVGNTGTSDILILRNNSTQIELLYEGVGIIAGAAYDGGSYFLPIRTHVNAVNEITNPGNTIVMYDGVSPAVITAAEGEVDRGFIGIINIGGSVAAIDRGGNLFNVSASISRTNINMEGFATGALAVWEDPSNPASHLLLAGRQGSLAYTLTGTGFTFGYVETPIPLGANFHEPGLGSPSTIIDGNNARYVSTIGRHGINHIFQVPPNVCGSRRLFASTQRSGLWSYRDHFNNGEWHWNAEY